MAALDLELDRSKELEGVAALLGCPFNLFDMVGWLAGCGWVGGSPGMDGARELGGELRAACRCFRKGRAAALMVVTSD